MHRFLHIDLAAITALAHLAREPIKRLAKQRVAYRHVGMVSAGSNPGVDNVTDSYVPLDFAISQRQIARFIVARSRFGLHYSSHFVLDRLN